MGRAPPNVGASPAAPNATASRAATQAARPGTPGKRTGRCGSVHESPFIETGALHGRAYKGLTQMTSLEAVKSLHQLPN